MVTLEKVQCVGLLNHLIEIPRDRGGVKMFDPIIDLDIFRELEEDIQPNREPVKKIVENSTLGGVGGSGSGNFPHFQKIKK